MQLPQFGLDSDFSLDLKPTLATTPAIELSSVLAIAPAISSSTIPTETIPTETIPTETTPTAKDRFQASLQPNKGNGVASLSLFPRNSIVGSNADDTLYGNSEWAWTPEKGTVLTFTDDMIFGLEGNDTLYGQGGDDFLYGGEDDDILYGGQGDDLLMGGANAYGKSGLDNFHGGEGADTFALSDPNSMLGNVTPHYLDGGQAAIDLTAQGIGLIQGLDNYAVIWDFVQGEDTIVWEGVAPDSVLTHQGAIAGVGNGSTDTLIFSDINNPGQFDLMAVVVDATLY